MAGDATRVLISFGANIDPLVNLRQGLSRLGREVALLAISTVYRTIPLGLTGQPDFLNGAALVETHLEPLALTTLLKRIETEQKRERGADPNAPRTLDLDIALFGESLFDPDVLERPFLAVTLAELAPEARRSGEGMTLKEIAAGFGENPPGMVKDDAATTALQALI